MNEKQIQEVMALVDEFGDSRRRQGNDEYSPESVNRRYAAQYGKDANELYSAIESALREQVREAPDKLPPFEQPDGADYGESHEEGYVSGWNACVDALLASTPAPAQQEPSEAEMVCAEAYQVVGCLLSDLGLFETEAARKILDNLSEARMVHQDVLLWESAVAHQEPPQQEREPMTDEQAFKSWKALREMKPSINAMSAFQAGIDLAERFHNITKEQQ